MRLLHLAFLIALAVGIQLAACGLTITTQRNDATALEFLVAWGDTHDDDERGHYSMFSSIVAKERQFLAVAVNDLRFLEWGSDYALIDFSAGREFAQAAFSGPQFGRVDPVDGNAYAARFRWGAVFEGVPEGIGSTLGLMLVGLALALSRNRVAIVVLGLSLAVYEATAATYAVVSGGQVVEFRVEEAGLIEAYRADPAKSAKVANLLPVFDAGVPATTLQQKVIDGGWIVTATNVFRAWSVVPLSAAEVVAANEDVTERLADRLHERLRDGTWERGARLDMLQSELLWLTMKAIIGANLQTNLTVAERQRAVDLRTEMKRAWDWATSVRTNIAAVKASATVVDPSTIQPLTGKFSE
jgi:hypothetical protein